MVGDNAGWASVWPANISYPSPGRLLTYPKSTLEWSDAEANVGLQSWGLNVTNDLGPDMCFGNTLLNSGVSRKVGFIPVALGGSILATDWDPPTGWPNLYTNMLNMTQRAMAAAGPLGRLRGMLFIEGEASAMTQYNQQAPIAQTWSANFTTFVMNLRADLLQYNPQLPIVLGVQRVADRDRVYPLISLIKQQQQDLVLPNLLKAQMEDKEFYPVNFTQIYGPQVGMQSIHMTAAGACAMGVDMAQQYINGLPTLLDQ